MSSKDEAPDEAPPPAGSETAFPDASGRFVTSGTVPLTKRFEAAHAESPLVSPAGGDFHDAFPLPDDSGKVGFVMGDVAGHGPRAAAHAENLKAAISGAIREGLPPAEALGFVNAAAEMDQDFHGFATVVAGTIEPNTGKIEYASGGHEPALVAAPAEASGTVPAAQALETTGPPVGAFGADEVRYRMETATLPAGGTLLLYTDGATEARRGRTLLGFGRLRDWFARFLPLSPLRLVRKLLGKVRAFGGGGTGPRDDVALLAVRRREGGEGPQKAAE